MLDVALEENLDVEFTYVGTMNGDPSAVAEIVSCPHAIPGTSDAGAHVEMECAVDFSDVLLGTWVREQGVMGLERGYRPAHVVSGRASRPARPGLTQGGHGR